MGVRVLYEGAWGFSATSDLSDLGPVFDRALGNAQIAARRVTFPVRLAEREALQAEFTSPCAIDPFEVPLADKVAFLKDMDERLDQPGVLQRIGDLFFIRKQILFLDSEGSEIEKQITDVFAQIQVSGKDKEGVTHERKFRLGREDSSSRGWESIDGRPLWGKRR